MPARPSCFSSTIRSLSRSTSCETGRTGAICRTAACADATGVVICERRAAANARGREGVCRRRRGLRIARAQPRRREGRGLLVLRADGASPTSYDEPGHRGGVVLVLGTKSCSAEPTLDRAS